MSLALAKLLTANPALRLVPWSKQADFLQSPAATRLLAWANRTGKTSIGAAEVCLAAEGIHPYNNHLYPDPPFTVWACSVDYKQMRDSVMVALEGDSTHPRMLPIGTRFKQQEMSYYLPSGSIIRLKSADTGRDSFQGAGLPLVWIDEELPEDILKELFIRIGPGYDSRFIWTMTAVKGLSYAYDHFVVPFQAWPDDHQGEQHPRIFYSEASMDECPHLTAAQIESVAEKYPEGSKELQIRRFGGFRDLAGDSVFSQQAIDLHRKQCREPEQQLVFEYDAVGTGYWPRQAKINTRPYNDLQDDWHVDVWRDLDPNDDYIVFGDIAVGCQVDPTNEDSPRDWNVIYVFNRSLQQFDAEFRSRCDPHTAGKVLWLLGHYYNYAWTSPEINSMGIAALGVLTGKTGLPPYGRIYQRRRDFDEWQPEIANDDLGWVTTQQTRGKMISDLYTALEPVATTGTVAVKVFSKGFVDEMVSFQKNTRTGKPEAIRGRHDDRIMSGAGCIELDILCPHGKPANMAVKTGQPAKGKKFNQAMVEGGAMGAFLVPGEKRRAI